MIDLQTELSCLPDGASDLIRHAVEAALESESSRRWLARLRRPARRVDPQGRRGGAGRAEL